MQYNVRYFSSLVSGEKGAVNNSEQIVKAPFCSGTSEWGYTPSPPPKSVYASDLIDVIGEPLFLSVYVILYFINSVICRIVNVQRVTLIQQLLLLPVQYFQVVYIKALNTSYCKFYISVQLITGRIRFLIEGQ